MTSRLECDVVVIGAGIAGAGIAAELSRDRRVLLLEQEDRPGHHATGRSAALHSEIYGNAVIRALTGASRDFFLEGDDGRSFASPRGCLHVATDGQLDALDAFGRLESVAPAVTRIDGAAARSRVPVLREGVIVAALEEAHAYDLDVDAIHQAFLRQLRRHNGALHCKAAVTTCRSDGDGWLVTAGAIEVRAPVVVNAAGAWADDVARNAGVAPVGLQPKRRTALTVDAPDGVSPQAWPAVIDIGEQFYFKPEAGRILLSPADETAVDPHDAYPDDLDAAIAIDRVQQVADLPVHRIAHSWAGLRTFAPDRTPVVGYDDAAPGFFWLAGQGGYGIQTSPALSRLSAALVRGEGIPADLAARHVTTTVLAPGRFRTAAVTRPPYQES
jgi:D-arginine dehydrogenase